jgi:transaldolase
MLASSRWQDLASKGARAQRLLWASTGVKDKSFPDTRYVVELVARDTVNTMPEATLRAVADHGFVRGDSILATYEAARETFAKLGQAGLDIADVADQLEREGVASFAKSWDQLIASVEEQLRKTGADVKASGAVTPPGGGSPASGAPKAGKGPST